MSQKPRKIRMGMIWGGEGSFIGGVHRMAANLDGQIELVAGCFSSQEERNQISGKNLFIDPRRIYSDFNSMAKGEAKLPESERIDFVSIVTPNHLHYAPAIAFLKNGFHVVFNNDRDNSLGLGAGMNLSYIDTNEGKVIPLNKISGRYVRLFSKGNTSNAANHYIEVEVYGTP